MAAPPESRSAHRQISPLVIGARRWLCTLLLVAPACSYPPARWVDPPTGAPESWRGLALRCCDDIWVLSRSETTATEAVWRTREVLEFVRDETGRDGPRGLLIALTERDEAVLPDSNRLQDAASLHFRKMIGITRSRDVDRPVEVSEDEIRDAGVDAEALFKALPGRLGVEGAEQFGIPYGAHVGWIVIVPTEEYVDATVGQLLRASMQLAELSWGQRVLAGTMMPFAKSRVVDAFRAMAVAVTCQACAESMGYDAEAAHGLAMQCVKDAGLSVEGLGL